MRNHRIMAAASLAFIGPDMLVGDGWPEADRQPLPRKAADPKIMTPEDHERQRLAQERRARKVSRQAKGFANNVIEREMSK